MKKKKDEVDKLFLFRERKCGNCGKEFLIHGADEWAYKDWRKNSLVYYCSWKCLRESEKNMPSRWERRDRILEMLRAGKTVKETAETLQETHGKVLYYKKKMDQGEYGGMQDEVLRLR